MKTRRNIFQASAFRLLAFLLCLLISDFWLPASGHANCTSPAAAAGSIEYFTSDSTHKICNGTAWQTINLNPASMGACSVPQGRDYDATANAFKICVAGNYEQVKCTAGALASGDNYCFASASAELTASNGAANDDFGYSATLSSDGNTALIAAYNKTVGANANQGAVYVFTRSGGVWTQQAELTASDGAAGDQFGNSVALSSDGNTALVGAYVKTVGANANQGAVYVFTRSGGVWTQQAKITASDGVANDSFGGSVVLSGNTALIGAIQKTVGAINPGAVYIFDLTTPSAPVQKAEFTSSDAASFDDFGFSVAVSGNTAVIGASGKGSGTGAAYIFDISNPASPVQKAEITLGLVAANFGNSVSLSGATALIGAKAQTVGSNANRGEVYVYDLTNPAAPVQQAGLTAADGAAGDFFGESVALSTDGNTALIGADFKKNPANYAVGTAYVFTRSAGVWTQQAEFPPSNDIDSGYFGHSVALSSDGAMALIGAYGKTVGANASQGAAYIMSGYQMQKITASNGASFDWFGRSAALSTDGATALIGAADKTVGANGAQGAAYVFTHSGSTWAQQTELTASNGAASDYFGYSAALSSDGNTALVGAEGKTVGANANQGAAYVFTRSGGVWTQQAELTASDGAASDNFGLSAALSSDGNTALIGAGAKASAQGAAYVFTRSGGVWTQQAELTASNGAANDYFGQSVALSTDGATALVGAYQKIVGANTNQGAAYVFTRSGGVWTQQAELTASDGASFNDFGYSVSLSGATALVGAYGINKAYVFDLTNPAAPVQKAILTPPGGVAGDNFGDSTALDSTGGTALIGAPNKTVGANANQGAVYLFTSSGSTWTQQAQLTAADGAAGDQFGLVAALSSAGNTALIGDFNKPSSTAQGAAYVYADNLPTVCANTAHRALGTASVKSATSPWTALSGVSLNQGDTLLVCVASSGTPNAITWNGVALTQDINGSSSFVYSLANPAAGTGDIVVSPGGAVTAITATAVSGLLTSSILDQKVAATGSSATPSSGAAPATTQANEFLFGCVGTNGPVGDLAGTWSNSFTAGQRGGSTGAGATSNMTASDGYETVSATGAYTAAKTGITSRNWWAAIATYKAILPSCTTYGACTSAGAVDYYPGNGLRWCNGANWEQISVGP